ncbi:MAG: sulfite exporter TauE/SafE family protein [Pseudomonadota bacterium]
MEHLFTPTLAAILATYFVAGAVKGAMGFGLPVVAVTILPFVVPVETALALNAVVIVLTNFQQIRQGGAYHEGFAAAWPMMLGMSLMVPIGALFTVGLSTPVLMTILGAFVILFVVSSFVNPALRTPPGWERRIGFGMGLASGFVGALTSAPGPIFVMYVVSLHLARPVYITALGFIMALFGSVVGLSYIWVGVLRWEHALPALVSVPLAIFGMWIGDRWARRLPVETFRKAVLILLGILALMLIRRALG